MNARQFPSILLPRPQNLARMALLGESLKGKSKSLHGLFYRIRGSNDDPVAVQQRNNLKNLG